MSIITIASRATRQHVSSFPFVESLPFVEFVNINISNFKNHLFREEFLSYFIWDITTSDLMYHFIWIKTTLNLPKTTFDLMFHFTWNKTTFDLMLYFIYTYFSLLMKMHKAGIFIRVLARSTPFSIRAWLQSFNNPRRCLLHGWWRCKCCKAAICRANCEKRKNFYSHVAAIF